MSVKQKITYHGLRLGKELTALLPGAFLYALGFHLFIAPSEIIMGGATGLATLAFVLYRFPVGLGVFLINIPLLLWGIKVDGKRSMLHTGIGILLTSVFLDFFSFLPPIDTDPLIAAVFGGAVMGVGIGILLLRGYTTGGSDLAASLLKHRFSALSTGTLIFVIDTAIVITAALIMRNLESLFYSVAVNVAFSVALDAAIGGAGKGKLACVISEKGEEMAKSVTEQMQRGVTLMQGKGFFSAKNKQILICVVKRNELYRLKEIVRETDAAAFVIVSEASEVLGEGFRSKESRK